MNIDVVLLWQSEDKVGENCLGLFKCYLWTRTGDKGTSILFQNWDSLRMPFLHRES